MPTPRVFLGANGFPAACYKPILQQLSATAVEYNHALIPGKFSNWHPLVDAVVAQVEKAAGSSGKVNGVGHSAGGALLCCAASVRPDLFEKVVIVDSPMFNPMKRALFSVGFHLPAAILEAGHPMIKSAMKKQNSWSSRAEAMEYWTTRRLFKTFDPAFTQAWLDEGLVDQPDGSVQLVFQNFQEAHMYKTTPTETPIIGGKNGILKQYDAVDVNGTFLYSNSYKFLERADVEFLKGNFKNLRFEGFDDEHFWPMTDCKGFADKVEHVLKDQE